MWPPQGRTGFALQDATPTILSWTAQNDGNLHIAILAVVIKVSSAETGGAISIDESGAIAANTQLTAGSLGPGTWFFFGNSAYTPVPVAPGGAFPQPSRPALPPFTPRFGRHNPINTVSLSQPLAPVNTSVDAVVDGGTYTTAIKTA